VLFDAPPSIGHNLQRAVDEVAAAEGVTNTVTHLVYTHHHSDHACASSLFGSNVVRVGHEEARRLLLRDNDPAKPAPEETFADRRTLEIGGERIQLAWHGANHSPDNIYIHFPDHDTLMLADIALPGWVPFCGIKLSEDVPGYMAAPAMALSSPWTHLIAGHLRRMGTRDDVTVHQQYIADIEAGARTALATVDPTPYFQKYGENLWAAVKGLPGCGGRCGRRARHREVHRRAGRRGCVHGPHRLFDPGVDPPGPRPPHGRSPVSKP
jgi:glyoxylase-like metal-dependent hydrolase (beta-lactamase superfamily II)